MPIAATTGTPGVCANAPVRAVFPVAPAQQSALGTRLSRGWGAEDLQAAEKHSPLQCRAASARCRNAPIHSRPVRIILSYILDGSQVAMPGNREMITTAITISANIGSARPGNEIHVASGHALQDEEIEPDGRCDLGNLDNDGEEHNQTRSCRSPPGGQSVRPRP